MRHAGGVGELGESAGKHAAGRVHPAAHSVTGTPDCGAGMPPACAGHGHGRGDVLTGDGAGRLRDNRQAAGLATATAALGALAAVQDRYTEVTT